MSLITFPRKEVPTPYVPEMELGEWDIIPNVVLENPMSFGKDFNLIRAVHEHAPQRVDEIDRELDAMQMRMAQLQTERQTLQRLIQALHTED